MSRRQISFELLHPRVVLIRLVSYILEACWILGWAGLYHLIEPTLVETTLVNLNSSLSYTHIKFLSKLTLSLVELSSVRGQCWSLSVLLRATILSYRLTVPFVLPWMRSLEQSFDIFTWFQMSTLCRLCILSLVGRVLTLLRSVVCETIASRLWTFLESLFLVLFLSEFGFLRVDLLKLKK